MSVCLSVDHERELGKNGWTDRDAVWDVNSGRPNELCIRWDPGLLQENETNVLRSRFNKCSTAVKCVLFRSHCICPYDAALWRNHTMGAIRRLTSCYIKCFLVTSGLTVLPICYLRWTYQVLIPFYTTALLFSNYKDITYVMLLLDIWTCTAARNLFSYNNNDVCVF